MIVGLFKVFVPKSELRNRMILATAWLGERWAETNERISDRMLPARWLISPLPPLQREGRYFIVANHQSAVDVAAVFRVFTGRIPFIRFFVKRDVMFMPVLGWALKAVEFPFMRRYTPEYLAKHPEKKGLDLVTTRRACRRYLRIPVTMFNFLEGTRFSRTKHEEQSSPYRHLLRPRIGGMAHAMAVMGDQLNDFLDVTISYDCADPSLWAWLTGRMREIRVNVREIDIPAEFRTEAVLEPGPVRERFKEWVNRLWMDKDALLDEMAGSASGAARESTLA
jgi:hypothetical protein